MTKEQAKTRIAILRNGIRQLDRDIEAAREQQRELERQIAELTAQVERKGARP
jgi:predicted  nucleic acid-binding Zn-ribbon protein